LIWKQIFGRCVARHDVQWRITNSGPKRSNVMGGNSRPQTFRDAEGLIPTTARNGRRFLICSALKYIRRRTVHRGRQHVRN
jgi:hypothetical protein